MGPKVDRTAPHPCSRCKVVKDPGEFYAQHTECKACGAAANAEKAAALATASKELHAPCGSLLVAADFDDPAAQWTITQGAKSAPKPRPQPYIRLDDLSPLFVEFHGMPDHTKATITSATDRVAHAAPHGKDAFVTVEKCKSKLLLKKCVKCGLQRYVRTGFATGDEGQLRAECRFCDATMPCDRCGEEKDVAAFSNGATTCTACVTAAELAESARKLAISTAKAENRRWCSGCGCTHPLADFDADYSICRRRRANAARSDARPERKEYHRRLNAEKKYYVEWRARQVALHPEEYRKKLADRQRDYYADNFEVMLRQKKTRATDQLDSIKRGAVSRGIVFELDGDDALGMIRSPCFYSGVYFPDVHVTGLDRVDSGVGYVKGNVVPCDGVVNCMKHRLGAEDFVLACAEVAEGGPGGILQVRYDNCVKRNMHAPLSFVELCTAVATNFDASKLP